MHTSQVPIMTQEKKLWIYTTMPWGILGNQAIITNWSEKELLDYIIKAANNGKLQTGL